MTAASKPPRCPRCLVGGYTQTTANDGRPLFRCSQCRHEWTCGLDGGTYARLEATNE